MELEIIVNGNYLNFKLPHVTREEFVVLQKKVKFLDDEVSFLHKEIEALKLGEKVEEIEGGIDDMHFPEPEGLGEPDAI